MLLPLLGLGLAMLPRHLADLVLLSDPRHLLTRAQLRQGHAGARVSGARARRKRAALERRVLALQILDRDGAPRAEVLDGDALELILVLRVESLGGGGKGGARQLQLGCADRLRRDRHRRRRAMGRCWLRREEKVGGLLVSRVRERVARVVRVGRHLVHLVRRVAGREQVHVLIVRLVRLAARPCATSRGRQVARRLRAETSRDGGADARGAAQLALLPLRQLPAGDVLGLDPRGAAGERIVKIVARQPLLVRHLVP